MQKKQSRMYADHDFQEFLKRNLKMAHHEKWGIYTCVFQRVINGGEIAEKQKNLKRRWLYTIISIRLQTAIQL